MIARTSFLRGRLEHLERLGSISSQRPGMQGAHVLPRSKALTFSRAPTEVEGTGPDRKIVAHALTHVRANIVAATKTILPLEVQAADRLAALSVPPDRRISRA